MSWQINGTGRYYHNYQEYQRVKERTERTSAAAQLRERCRALEKEMSDIGSQLGAAGLSAGRERELTAALHAKADELETMGGRITSAVAASMAEIQQEFSSFSHACGRTAEERRGLESSFKEWQAEWRERQRQEDEELARMTERMRSDFRATIAVVERRTQDLRQNLEQDRQQRMAARGGRMDQAKATLAEVASSIPHLLEQARSLHDAELEGRAKDLAEGIERVSGQENDNAALIAATDIWARSKGLEEELLLTRARLSAAAERVNTILQDISAIHEDEEVRFFHAREIATARTSLSEILEERHRVFADAGAYRVRMVKWEQTLRTVLDGALRMKAASSDLKQRYVQRIDLLEAAADRLCGTMGELAPEGIRYQMVDPVDMKSVLQYDLVFASGEKVRLAADIDGNIKGDSWGQRDNLQCSASHDRVRSAVEGVFNVASSQHDHGAFGHAPSGRPPMPPP